MYAVPGTITEETIMHNNLLEQIRALRLGLLLEHELFQRKVSKVNRLQRLSKLRLPSQLDYRP